MRVDIAAHMVRTGCLFIVPDPVMMDNSTKEWLRLPWLLTLLFLAGVALLSLPGEGPDRDSLLDGWDARGSDWMLRLAAHNRQPPANIVLVRIDDKSLENISAALGEQGSGRQIGAWPWPRDVHAEMIADLEDRGVDAIVFDMFFSTPDNFRPDSDQALRDVAAQYPNLYFASLLMNDGSGVPLRLVPPSLGLTRNASANPEARAPLQVPLILNPQNWQGGLVNFDPDADGTARHTRLLRHLQGWTLPSLVTSVARPHHWVIPGDRIRLNWYGGNFRSHSYSDLMAAFSSRHGAPAPDLKNAIVLIGASASGLADFRPTAMQAQQQGMEILATAMANLQDRDWLRDLPWRLPLLLVLLPALAWSFARRQQPWRIGLVLLGASAGLLAGSYLLLTQAQLFAPVVVTLACIWLFFSVQTLGAQLTERREREATVTLFGRFLDPRVVKDLVKSGELSPRKVAESREITVLFSDIRGFTTLSESRSPEVVVSILNRYFSQQVAIIFRHGGTLDKFIGDAIMAFWNAPTQDNQHATNAVRAALEMAQALDDFKRQLAGEDPTLADFDIGIGIHTGPAVVGFIGAESRLDYTVMGDTVNLASRIEGCTKGISRVLVSAATRQACNAEAAFRDHGEFHVKGRQQGVQLFEPLP